MKKNKGFTLIELLAVIVVLAVIALIATPIVLKLVNNAKEGAAESSATAYIKAVENGIVSKLIQDPTAKVKGTFTVSADRTKIISESGTEIEVDVKGSLPSQGGIITIDSNGIVTNATLNISNYEIECTADKCSVKGKKEQEEEEIEQLVGDPILTKAKTLVYDENGTCKTDGTTYNYMDGCYIKGASNNNYIWYNGFMWRIMGINSDETVRLITDENVTTLAYGPENSALTYTSNEGYVHDLLNIYFYNHLNNTKAIIQNGAYFCNESTNDQNLTEGRATCTSGSEVTSKIGILSLDEYLLSNTSTSYLNIRQWFWTMTPYSDSKAWVVRSTHSTGPVTLPHAQGVRPVINVSADSIITVGDGSATDFYVLEEDKTTSITGRLIDKVTSGEYVSLEGHTYRVVSKDSNVVKLILDGFYEETEGTPYTMSYGNDNTFTLDSGIGQKLNGDVLTWLGLSASDKIQPTIYYQGDGMNASSTYSQTLKQSNGVEAKVGLIQAGDILSSQSSTMLTKNYTVTSSNNTKTYWTMSKYTEASYAWGVLDYGFADCISIYATNMKALRPVITVRDNLEIISGTGTWKNPYQI